MPTIPRKVLSENFPDLGEPRRGKVRDTYFELIGFPGLLLVVATDRVSIFDFVLPTLINFKGYILTAMNIFWRHTICNDISHDLVAFGSGIDKFLPVSLRGNKDLQSRAVVVIKHEAAPVEAIARGCVAGTGWTSYVETGMICGHKLPPGLKEGDELPVPLFTPTTKAEVGHDLHLNAWQVEEKYPFMKPRVLELYGRVRRFARERGIMIADTKCELSVNGSLIDEAFTPDSSRYWSYNEWVAMRATGGIPNPYDKELVRIYGNKIGFKGRSPENQDDLDWVAGLTIPEEIREGTTQRYLEIFNILTGMPLQQYQQEVMRIAA